LKIAYRKSWTTLKAIETKLGFPLLERKVVGIAGGGSHINKQGRILMSQYEEFRVEVKKTLEKIYQKHFGYGTNQ
jgi:molybdate transport repressor ModE-like protein